MDGSVSEGAGGVVEVGAALGTLVSGLSGGGTLVYQFRCSSGGPYVNAEA